MSDLADALGGALGLIIGGFIFLLFAGTLENPLWLDFGTWGIVYILGGALICVTTIAAFLGGIVGR